MYWRTGGPCIGGSWGAYNLKINRGKRKEGNSGIKDNMNLLNTSFGIVKGGIFPIIVTSKLCSSIADPNATCSFTLGIGSLNMHTGLLMCFISLKCTNESPSTALSYYQSFFPLLLHSQIPLRSVHKYLKMILTQQRR